MLSALLVPYDQFNLHSQLPCHPIKKLSLRPHNSVAHLEVTIRDKYTVAFELLLHGSLLYRPYKQLEYKKKSHRK